MASAIHFRDAVAVAGRFPLLAGVDLEVAEGEVVHLRGPNGAGKTSLLRAAAGLVAITSGEAVVLGLDLLAERREVRRQVGLLGHATFLYEELSVADNLRFAARAARVGDGTVEPALERLGLAGRLRDVQVARLSAGQRRRAALAVLVARSPRLWLLDEPHAGLDEGGRAVVDTLVAEVRAAGATVLIASHELDRAGQIADRTLWVAGGRVTGLPGTGASAPGNPPPPASAEPGHSQSSAATAVVEVARAV